MSNLPIHSTTGLQAIGFTSRGPVWPVMGAAEEPETPEDPAPPQPDPPAKGYPEKPLAEMTADEQVAYWKHHARKHEDALKGFGNLTAEQAKSLQERVQELENEKLTADQRAVKEAAETAAAEARAAAEAEWKPRLLSMQLKATAGRVLSGEQLDSWLEDVNPEKYVGSDGLIDEEKVMGRLTALFGQVQQQFGPTHRDWGQHQGLPPAAEPGAAGRAEALRRQGKTT